MMNRNLLLLTLSQVFGFTTATITVFLSGIVGSEINTNQSLSTLPTALFVVGTASFTVLAANIMSKIGRRNGFVLAAIGSSSAALVAAFAISQKSFILFCLSCLFLGMGAAFNHRYRFAAAESVKKEMIPKAISTLLLAGIVSAFLGITLADYTKDFIQGNMYVGSYLLLSFLSFMPGVFLFFFKNNVDVKNEFQDQKNIRDIKSILIQPKFLQAITAAAFAYAVMSFLMTATPLSMHVIENISLKKTGIVLQIHVVAMFLPSLFTGNLIKKFGHSAIIYLGVFFFALTVFWSVFDQSYFNYMLSLIFLGLGWNFLFISGTSLVVLTYKSEEKFKVQGFNDLIVFSTMALASLSAGILLNSIGWKTMNLICIPFLILIILISLIADKKSKQ